MLEQKAIVAVIAVMIIVRNPEFHRNHVIRYSDSTIVFCFFWGRGRYIFGRFSSSMDSRDPPNEVALIHILPSQGLECRLIEYPVSQVLPGVISTRVRIQSPGNCSWQPLISSLCFPLHLRTFSVFVTFLWRNQDRRTGLLYYIGSHIRTTAKHRIGCRRHAILHRFTGSGIRI